MFQFGISTRLAHNSTITHPGEKFQKIKDKGKGKAIPRTGHEVPKRE